MMLLSVYSVCPSLQQIIIFDRSVVKDRRDVSSIYFDDFLAMGEGLPHIMMWWKNVLHAPKTIRPIFYILRYDGEPKRSHVASLSASCEAFRIHIRLVDMSDKDVSMNFPPLTHVFEKAWVSLYP